MNAAIESKGGNQYLVTIGEESRMVDLDGFTIMSNEDYSAIEQAGLLQDDMECPATAKNNKLWDNFELAALEYAANYSGFDAEEYIANHAE